MTRKILGIAGSLRRDSYNKAVLRTLAELNWKRLGGLVGAHVADVTSTPTMIKPRAVVR
jgi:NAD(P)H-dependent FMN reductase